MTVNISKMYPLLMAYDGIHWKHIFAEIFDEIEITDLFVCVCNVYRNSTAARSQKYE